MREKIERVINETFADIREIYKLQKTGKGNPTSSLRFPYKYNHRTPGELRISEQELRCLFVEKLQNKGLYYNIEAPTMGDYRFENAEGKMRSGNFDLVICDQTGKERYETTYRSAVYSFTTEAGPRAIRLDGVSNTRDAGGMAAGEGYRVKQGMIYRGGLLENITPESRDYFVNVLGVKTDLDLRAANESGAGTSVSSPLGATINYVNVSGRYYINSLSNGNGIDVDSNGENNYMLQELRVFADPNNYPIYVHCSLGRDRTGTLIMLVQGLLGVSKTDMALDYEFSALSDYGTLDNPYNGFFSTCRNAIFNYISVNYEGDTLSEQIENYMLDIGLTPEEINSIKTTLLEEVK